MLKAEKQVTREFVEVKMSEHYKNLCRDILN